MSDTLKPKTEQQADAQISPVVLDISALRQIHAATTGGKWRIGRSYTSEIAIRFGEEDEENCVAVITELCAGEDEANAAYICEAHIVFPALLDELEELRGIRLEYAKIKHRLELAGLWEEVNAED